MKLPIPREEAEKQWLEFEEYLVQERYSVRDPKTGDPLEMDFGHVITGGYQDENLA